MTQINLAKVLEGEQPKVLQAMRVALAALQDGNTVNPEALTQEFLRAIGTDDNQWIAARDGTDVHG